MAGRYHTCAWAEGAKKAEPRKALPDLPIIRMHLLLIFA